MTIPVPNGPELPPDPVAWQWIPVQQGEFLGRILDPVRDAALGHAVRLATTWAGGVSVEWILSFADKFEAYLDPPEERSAQ